MAVSFLILLMVNLDGGSSGREVYYPMWSKGAPCSSRSKDFESDLCLGIPTHILEYSDHGQNTTKTCEYIRVCTPELI